MFKSQKFSALFVTELALPLIILTESVASVYFWRLRTDIYYRQRLPSDSAEYIAAVDKFDFFFSLTMISGLTALISMIVIVLAATIFMIKNRMKKTRCEHCTTRNTAVIAGGIFCCLAVLLIMFVTLVFTYGQGV